MRSVNTKKKREEEWKKNYEANDEIQQKRMEWIKHQQGKWKQ